MDEPAPSSNAKSQPVDIPLSPSSPPPANHEEDLHLGTSASSVPRLKARTSTTSHTLANSSSLHASRKGRVISGENKITSDQAQLSMPPPARPLTKSRTSSTYSQRAGGLGTENWKQADRDRTLSNDFAVEEDFEGQKLFSSSMAEPTLPDRDSNRMSVSSMYSLASARAGGAPSSVASANGSEAGTGPGTRTTSGTSISTAKGLGISQPETATSTVSILTSSSNQFNNDVGISQHQLTTRESLPYAIEAKQPAPPRPEGTPRMQPPARDRSRAKRRFSGSTGTAQSSQSPSSERGLLPKKEEAPHLQFYGMIGVCALDGMPIYYSL